MNAQTSLRCFGCHQLWINKALTASRLVILRTRVLVKPSVY
jgi:hypothetical protein